MRLRRQLLLASVFTLSLPWVGCQYIREVETVLIEGQNQALLTTAKAMRTVLESDQAFIEELSRIHQHRDAQAIHLHRLSATMRLDGYKEEWDNAQTPPQLLPPLNADASESSSARIWAAESADRAWLFVDVPFAPSNYYSPGKDYRQSDQLRLSVQAQQQDSLQHYRVITSSPGLARVFSEAAGVNSVEHRIKAYWRELSNGYQIELSLPRQWSSHAVGVEILSEGQVVFSNTRAADDPPPATRTNDSIVAKLRQFDLNNLRVDLAAANGAFLGEAGNINQVNKRNPPWFMQLIFDFALRKEEYPELADAKALGHFRHNEGIIDSLSGKANLSNYQYRGSLVTSASVPIRGGKSVVGSLIAIQNTNNLSAFTDAAFNRLLMYSILVTLGAALAFGLYASWLSYRILQLRKSVREAVSDQGGVVSSFKASAIKDEIGDLSRGFGDLLQRLKDYTDYLKTLSNRLSHELRTPLAIVSSSLDNLEQETDPLQAQTFVTRAKSGTERISRILNAMSATQRVEQSIATATHEPVNLHTLLHQLVDAYRDAYPHAQFSLQTQVEPNQTSILGAPDLIVQLLDKLIDNAVDFCTPGQSIRIELIERPERLIIGIANPGPHLADTMRDQLFDSMVSLRKSNASANHLGFGLYIAKIIAQSHNAFIEAKNIHTAEGEGFDGVWFEVHFVPAPSAASSG